MLYFLKHIIYLCAIILQGKLKTKYPIKGLSLQITKKNAISITPYLDKYLIVLFLESSCW